MKSRLHRIILPTICIIMTLGIIGVILNDPEISYAGGLNAAEERVLSASQGTFTYKGVSYKATSSSVAELRSYMCRDGVDLTDAQASKAINYMYGNVRLGILRGYILPVGGGKSEASEKKDNGIKKEKAGSATVTVDLRNSSYTLTSKTDEEILSGETIVKNTGADFRGPVVMVFVAFAMLIAAVAVTIRKKLYR